MGEHFGFPDRHLGTMQDPDVKGRQCSEFYPPALLLGAHTGGARHALLHRRHVPGRVQELHVHRPARVVEPHPAGRLRRGERHARRPGQADDAALPRRAARGQQLPRPADRRAAAAGLARCWSATSRWGPSTASPIRSEDAGNPAGGGLPGRRPFPGRHRLRAMRRAAGRWSRRANAAPATAPLASPRCRTSPRWPAYRRVHHAAADPAAGEDPHSRRR